MERKDKNYRVILFKTKQCNRCFEIKKVIEFWRRPAGDGVLNQCRDCRKLIEKEKKKSTKTKKCSKCKLDKSKDCFVAATGKSADGLHYWCIECDPNSYWIPLGKKICSKCKELKSMDDYFADASTKRKVGSVCIECKKIYRSTNEYQIRDNTRSWGITSEDYLGILEEQLGVCAIEGCQRSTYNGRRLAIDHDHSTCHPGRFGCSECIRGLLCGAHNTALGLAGDSPSQLRAMADYLESGNRPLAKVVGN